MDPLPLLGVAVALDEVLVDVVEVFRVVEDVRVVILLEEVVFEVANPS